MFKQLLRSALLLGGMTLCAASSLAQDYGYSVLIDLDRQSGTGCTVDLGGGNVVPGIERRLSAWSSSGVFQVASLTLEVCQGGSFGPATGVGGPYPIGLNNGVGGADVVELGASLDQLAGTPYPAPFRVYFGAESASGSDLLAARAGGGAIIVGGPSAPVPGLGWLGLSVLVLGVVLILRGRRWRPMLRNSGLALLIVGSGLVFAANFALDGQVGDWAGSPPIATDPAGDSTSGQSSIDITAGFVGFENNHAYFRIDLRDVQNNPPTAHPVAATGLEDTPLVVLLTGADNESPSVTFAIASAPASGTLGPITTTSPTTAEVTYTPAADSNGADSFTFTVNDGELTSAPATASLTIQPVNDAPSFTAQNATIFEDGGAQTATVATDILAGPPDEAGQSLSFDITGNDNPGLFAGTPTISPAGVLTATPAPGQLGSANLTVVLRDNGGTANGGIDASAAQTIVVTVDDVNDPPSFTPGAAPTVLEDAGAQSLVSWATAIDDGDGGGQTLTFVVQGNSNPALFADAPAITPAGTLSFTAAADANGSADITIVLTDDGGTANGGNDTSSPHTFTITVTSVNDAPDFSAANPPSVFQDSGPAEIAGWAAFSPGPANESAQVALEYQVSAISNAALFSAAPTVDAATGTLRYTPAAGARGTSQFIVRVRDDGGTANGGVDLSDPQTFTITVEAVNNPPSFTPGPDVTVLEDVGAHTVPAWATAIDDNDGDTQVLTFVVQNNSNPGLFAAAPQVNAGTGTLSFTPADDANGSAQITLVLQDDGGTANGGGDTSPPHVLTITVTPVNDAPDFTAANPPSVFQDSGPAEVAGWAAFSPGPANESAQVALEYQVSAISNAALFSAAPTVDAATGTLRYTPAAGARGTSQFTVRVRDDGGTANGGVDLSDPQTFTITVEAVNNPPSFTPGPDVTVLEDVGAHTVPAWATAIDDNDGDTQVLTFVVQNNSNPGLFAAAPQVNAGTGTLSFTPADDANGSAQITLVLQDDGGTANGGGDTSPPHVLTITVTPVNDAPSFTLQNPPASLEDAGAQNATVATAISAGPADESGQAVSFTVTPVSGDATLSFAVPPTISSAGALTYTAAANAWGTATFNVVAQDDGGTANGGVDTSAPQTLTITVTGVNDEPSFTAADPAASAEDAGAQTVAGWVTGFDPGPNEAGQSVAEYLVSAVSNPSLFSAAPVVATDGTLSYTAAPDQFGTSQFTVRVRDDGGTANGGIDLSATQTFTITVTAVNDPPVLDLNGPAAGTGFSASFTEGVAPVAIVDAAAMTVTDIDSALLVSATVTITNVLDGADEVLAVDATGSGLTVNYAAGVLSLTGSAAPSVYQTVLRTTTYANGSNNPDETQRLIEFIAEDAEGGVSAPPAVATVSVAGVNSAPVFTPGSTQSVLEDAGAQTVVGWAAGIHDGDDGTQGLTFLVQANTNPALFAAGPAVAANGTLSYTTAADANGTASITIVLQDDGGTANGGTDTSAPATFSIIVTPVNDAPSFTVPAVAPPVLENAGAQAVVGFAQDILAGPPDEAGQALAFDVTVTGTTSSLSFTAAPSINVATGTLTYTPQTDTSGTATVEVVLRDNGGTVNGGVDASAPQTFTIDVQGVNSAPVFTPGGPVTVNEDSGAYNQPWATGIDDGDLDEVQALEFIIQNNSNPGLFSVGPVVDAVTGNLSFDLVADAFGVANITLVLRDDGGTANGGVDTSAPATFSITVQGVNDPPSFDMPASAPTVLEDAGAQTVAGFASNMSTGPANESGQTLTGFTVTVDSIDPTLSFSAAPVINLATGTLTYTAAANAFGTATLTATLQDDGGTANGGIDTFSRSFTINVTDINDAPSFTPGGNVNVLEDAGPQNLPWATGMNDGDGGTQVLTFLITNNTNPGLFSTQPAINVGTGNLSFTTLANAFGVADITVVLQDNGGTANGGVDSTAPVTFTINVAAVNDPPVVVVPSNVPVHRHIGVVIPVAHAHNLLANVSDVDGPGAEPFTLTVVNDATSTQGGRYSTFADGSWTYHPPASNTIANDNFSVQVCDSGVPLPPACSNATVTIALSGPAIWFVDAAATPGGDGTLARPLQTLAAATTAAGVNGRIFKFSGNHTGGATLLDGQQLIGQGVTGASFDALFGITAPALSVARPTIGGTRPLVTTTGGTVHGITLGNGNTIRGIEIGNTSGAGLRGNNFGTLTLGENRLSGSGQALDLTTGTLAQVPSQTAFDQITSTSGVSNIALSGVAGTANFGSGALSGATGTAFAFNTGTAAIAYAGSINKTAAGRLIDIDGAGAATLILSGDLSCTGACGTGAGNAGVRITGRTGNGTYTFSGSNKSLSSSGANAGVTLVNNSIGSAIGFDNGGLSVTTTSGTAFHADGGGTISVRTGASPNTLSATAGVALNVVNTPIGATDMTFRSISASGSSSGIVLNNTGTNGSLMVAGNGGVCSSAVSCTGGAIQNTVSHGIWLQNTVEPTFSRMFVNNTGGHGVGGTEVNGFSFTDGHITGSGTDAGARHSNIGFNVTANGTERNIHGAVTVTGNTLLNSRAFGVELYNYNGTISHANISNNTLTSTTSAATSQGWAISLIAYGSNTTTAHVTRADIANNVITNFPGGGGIQAQGGNSSAAGGAGTFGTPSHATNIINISGNRIAGQSAANRIGAEAIVASVGGRGQGNFNISNNGTVANPIANVTGIGISNSTFGNATVTSTINNNVIVANNSFAAQGIGGGLGNTFGVTDTPQMTVNVTNNTISQVDGNGILLVARDTRGTLNARIQGNNVAAPLTGVRPGIRVDSGNTLNGDNDTVCLNISGNVSAGSGGHPGGIGLRKQGTDPNQFRFGIHGMAATASPGIEMYVNGLNPGGNGTLLISATSGFTNCNLP